MGKSRRGLIDERVKGRRRGEGPSASSPLFQAGEGVFDSSSSANFRKIFLPRLEIEMLVNFERFSCREDLTKHRACLPHA